MKRNTMRLPMGKVTTFGIVLLLLLAGVKPIQAQSLDLNLSTGYKYQVHNLPPTLCYASGAKSYHFYYQWWGTLGTFSTFALPFIETLDEPLNVGANHILEARKTHTVIVDIPYIGDLPAANWGGMYYMYGTKNGNKTEGFIDVYDLEESPGNMRYKLPVTFNEGTEDAFLIFPVRDGSLQTTYVTNVAYIPITVTGPTVGPEVQVPILDTIVDPQIPYLVLHAPPGDGSSSSFVEDKTSCQKIENKVADALSHDVNLALKVGVAGEAGLFVTTSFEFSVTFNAGLKIQDKSISTEAYETCVSVSEGFKTSSLTNTEGGGDIFIGYGSDLGLGAYELVVTDQATCSAGRDSAVIYARLPNTEKKFVYTSEGIENEIATLQARINDSLSYDARSLNNFQNQIDVWNQVLDMNYANVNNPDNPSIETVSFNNNTSQTHKTGIKVVESNTIAYEYFTEVKTGIETKVEVGGSGFKGGYEFKASRTLGETRNQNASDAEIVSYTLSDDDPGDIFDVEIVQDPMYGTPIFRVLPSTKSSCPYQGGYQRDQPRLTFEDGSQSLSLSDLPVGSKGTFKVRICNESSDPRTYYLKGNPATNNSNAVLEGFGNNLFSNTDLGVEFWMIPPDSCVEAAVITIEQSDLEELDYENIELFLYSACQPSHKPIASSIFLDAHFVEEDATGLGEDGFAADFKLYPNPNKGQFNLQFEGISEEGHVTILDFAGKVVYSRKIQAGTEAIELNSLNPLSGIYLVVFSNEHGRVSRKMLVEN